jgi:3-hydroxyacyl-[acyl-carrier-protein] dehydratase
MFKIMNIFTQQLYTIQLKDISSVVIVLADENHPIFKAHFEGNPLLPAFLHVDIAAEIFGFEVVGISRSKFMEPLLPNDEVVVSIEQRPVGVRVRLVKDTHIASEINLEIQ